jgi:transglutaminase-like putative cysteine protease
MWAVSAAAPPAPGRGPDERAPGALLPAWVARLVGFAALACLGVSQWARMVAGLGALRPLLWVFFAVLAAAGVVACDRVAARWRGAAMLGVALLGLLAAYVVTGLDLGLLKPRRIDELASGLVSGAQALSTVRLPYDGADPWPGIVLQLLGSALVMISALVAFWPRGDGSGGRGYPFLALAALLVLAAAPVVSIGGTAPLLLGAGLTLLTVTFLWLERLPLRPGLGVAALIGLALAGALPIAAAADRGDPWFDYQAFAEGLGPKDPVRFDWSHGDYGPVTWSRSGAEVARIKARQPAYWKVQTLDDFDGSGWDQGALTPASDDPSLDLPANWETQTRWQDRIQVSIQRMRGTGVIGAGTTRDIVNPSRTIQPGVSPGSWQSVGDLRTGDSYSADVYAPRPTADQLAAVPGSPTAEHPEDLKVRVKFRELTIDEYQSLPKDMPTSPIDGRIPDSTTIDFQPYGREGVGPTADYRQYDQVGRGTPALKLSTLSRTWALAQRLKARTSTPYEYALAINDYLKNGFTYSEKPPVAPETMSPLEWFLFDTKKGYCQHFSGAMALLLRMGGVPARVATGFSPGGYSKRKAAWIVRDTDAHSWVEAWFDGYGWVTMDPTPSDTPARSQIATLAAPGTPTDASGDAAGAADGAGGAADANRRAAGSREQLFDKLRGGAGTASDDPAASSGGGLPLWPVVGLVVLLSVGGGFVAARRRRPRPSDPLDRAIFELETALRRSGRAAPAGMTLRQLERRLGLSNEAAGYLRAVGDARYGARGAPPTNAQRKALRRELASGQGPLGRLRTFWALPPRR